MNLMNVNDLIVIYRLLLVSFILIFGCTKVAYNTYTNNICNENKLNKKENVKEKKRKRKKRHLVLVGYTNRDWMWAPSGLGWRPLSRLLPVRRPGTKGRAFSPGFIDPVGKLNPSSALVLLKTTFVGS
jgi:hypothetical protein